MAHGEDTGAHPGRKVDTWKEVGPHASVVGEHGRMTSYASDDDVEMGAWRNPAGYTATVEHTEQAVGGRERTDYVAGPFRTRHRSERAADALSKRVRYGRGGGGTEYYQRSQRLPWEE